MTADDAVFAGHVGSVERMKLRARIASCNPSRWIKQPGISNYFIGNDPSKWQTNWPQGQTQPPTATLNAYDGAVTNNMAIVPTTTGSVSVFPFNPTHLVLDIFGYFAQ